jgi:uncharacterized protein
MVELVEVSRRDARRVALAAQGFAGPRPRGRVDRRHFRKVLEQVATVQLDSVNVLTRSHELIFFARLGPYDRDALTRWLWSSREVFEYWGHEASLHPVARHPLFRWRMAEDHAWGGVRQSARDNPDLVDAALAQVLADGPISVGQLEAQGAITRSEAGWWGWGDGKRVLEHLFWSGQVAVTRRNGFERAYLAPQQWFAAEVLAHPTPDEAEAQRALLRVAARACGIGTARDLADYYRLRVPAVRPLLDEMVADGELTAVRVEGWKQPAYLHPESRRPRRRLSARALLSPFDSLIWERQRTERLWGFRYRIEIYTPAPKRVHGYYVLPFLLDEDLVARVDLKSDRKAGVLLVQAAWSEGSPAATADGTVVSDSGGGGDRSGVDRDRVAAELAVTLREMAGWLGLANGVEVKPRGDLAAALALVAPG